MLLRVGLEIADRIVVALPARVAYWVADLAGDAWFRLAPARRRLVTANLRRVSEATGRPTSGRPLTDLVRAAFRNHARYYVELLRAPHYPPDDIGRHVVVPDWARFESILRSGPVVLVTAHLGNFEPFGTYLAAHGFRALSPIEEIRPRALFEFLAARRGAGSVELVPLRESRTAVSRRLREGGLVGIIGDRVIGSGGHPVTLFGHPAAVPIGPATMAVTYGATVIAGRCLRLGPDRFRAEGDVVEQTNDGERRERIEALATALAARFERDIGEAPEQWWGAFQPVWPDLEPAS